jgi:hypothetical protein
MTNSDAVARFIAGLGAAVAQVSAFDAQALEWRFRSHGRKSSLTS